MDDIVDWRRRLFWLWLIAAGLWVSLYVLIGPGPGLFYDIANNQPMYKFSDGVRRNLLPFLEACIIAPSILLGLGSAIVWAISRLRW
jgi:hypothetical protein